MEKDHLEIILEDINGKFNLVLEGHGVLNKTIDDTRQVLHEEIALNTSMIRELNKKVDRVRDDLTEKIEKNTAQIITLDKKIDGVEARLSEKIDKVATDLAEHRTDTEQHRTGYKVSES